MLCPHGHPTEHVLKMHPSAPPLLCLPDFCDVCGRRNRSLLRWCSSHFALLPHVVEDLRDRWRSKCAFSGFGAVGLPPPAEEHFSEPQRRALEVWLLTSRLRRNSRAALFRAVGRGAKCLVGGWMWLMASIRPLACAQTHAFLQAFVCVHVHIGVHVSDSGGPTGGLYRSSRRGSEGRCPKSEGGAARRSGAGLGLRELGVGRSSVPLVQRIRLSRIRPTPKSVRPKRAVNHMTT